MILTVDPCCNHPRKEKNQPQISPASRHNRAKTVMAGQRLLKGA